MLCGASAGFCEEGALRGRDFPQMNAKPTPSTSPPVRIWYRSKEETGGVLHRSRHYSMQFSISRDFPRPAGTIDATLECSGDDSPRNRCQ